MEQPLRIEYVEARECRNVLLPFEPQLDAIILVGMTVYLNGGTDRGVPAFDRRRSGPRPVAARTDPPLGEVMTGAGRYEQAGIWEAKFHRPASEEIVVPVDLIVRGLTEQVAAGRLPEHDGNNGTRGSAPPGRGSCPNAEPADQAAVKVASAGALLVAVQAQ